LTKGREELVYEVDGNMINNKLHCLKKIF